MLRFPNQSRTYDAVPDRVSFWGHDGALEISFFLKRRALFRLYPGMSNSEAAILAAFDAGRIRIHEIAAKAYSRDRQSSYVLGLENL